MNVDGFQPFIVESILNDPIEVVSTVSTVRGESINHERWRDIYIIIMVWTERVYVSTDYGLLENWEVVG